MTIKTENGERVFPNGTKIEWIEEIRGCYYVKVAGERLATYKADYDRLKMTLEQTDPKEEATLRELIKKLNEGQRPAWVAEDEFLKWIPESERAMYRLWKREICAEKEK